MKTKRTSNRSKKTARLFIACSLFFAPLTGFAIEGDSLNQKSDYSAEEASYRSTREADLAENSEMEISLESWMLDVDSYLFDEEDSEIEIETWMTDPSDPFWAEVKAETAPEIAFETWMAHPERW